MVGMVRGFSLRSSLNLKARLALLNLLKLCAGPDFDNLDLSNYVISCMFETPDDNLSFCFYYTACKKVLLSTHKKKSINPEGPCHNCVSRCDLSTAKGKYILMVDLKYQIERLFLLSDVKTALLELYRGENHLRFMDNSITDSQDGSLYKKLKIKFEHRFDV